MTTDPKMHVTVLGKLTEAEVGLFQSSFFEMITTIRATGVEASSTKMTYRLSTVEDMAKVADGHLSSLHRDIPLLAATFKVADKEMDKDIVLADIFPSVVFAPDLGDNLVLATPEQKMVSQGSSVRLAARAHDFVDEAIARASVKKAPGF